MKLYTKSIESLDIGKSTQVQMQALLHIWVIYKFFYTYNASAKAEMLSLHNYLRSEKS